MARVIEYPFCSAPANSRSYNGSAWDQTHDLATTAQIRVRYWDVNVDAIINITTIIPHEWDGTAVWTRWLFESHPTTTSQLKTFDVGARACANGEQANVAIAMPDTLSITLGGGGTRRWWYADVATMPANTPSPGDGLLWKCQRTDVTSNKPRILAILMRFGAN
jgi:hypothetical protein